jgi:hypothetical protein
MLLDQHPVLKVLAERMPVKMWVPVLALQRALVREDILAWLLSTNPAAVCARDAYNICTIFVGNNKNAENRCVVFCGPDCSDAVDEARIINDAELLAAAVTTDDSKCKYAQRWLARTPTAVVALPAAMAGRQAGDGSGGVDCELRVRLPRQRRRHRQAQARSAMRRSAASREG